VEAFRAIVIRSGDVDFDTLFGQSSGDCAHREARAAAQGTN
jgi:hypothetical protein